MSIEAVTNFFSDIDARSARMHEQLQATPISEVIQSLIQYLDGEKAKKEATAYIGEDVEPYNGVVPSEPVKESVYQAALNFLGTTIKFLSESPLEKVLDTYCKGNYQWESKGGKDTINIYNLDKALGFYTPIWGEPVELVIEMRTPLNHRSTIRGKDLENLQPLRVAIAGQGSDGLYVIEAKSDDTLTVKTPIEEHVY